MENHNNVQLDSELPFTDFIDPYNINEIISSKNFKGGSWERLSKLKDFNNGIHKSVLPIDISQFNILVVSEVIPDRLIKKHKHDDEPQFRYILSGSFILNDEVFNAGDWVIVPQSHEYEIFTETGYTTIAGYGMSCRCSAVGGH